MELKLRRMMRRARHGGGPEKNSLLTILANARRCERGRPSQRAEAVQPDRPSRNQGSPPRR